MYHTSLDTLPRSRYGIVYADPAWTYQDKALAGQRGAGCKYALMTDLELMAMPVQSLCLPDAVCFMWCTMPKLAEGLALMAAWGFTYKTVAFTWIKRNPKAGSLFWGMGRWTRANPEVVLFGTRGRPLRVSASVHSVIEAPIGPHSRKPARTRERITELMGNLPRVELFARGDTPGWDAWGNTPIFVTE